MVEILTELDRIATFIPKVQQAADQHRSELGFLPASVYEQAALQGKLWVGVSGSDCYSGHLLFGGRYPDLKVVQLYVQSDKRRSGIASKLIGELVLYGQKHQYTAITARVASDLPANQFWERHGFRCTRQIAGGKTTNRSINVRVRLLDVPRLFDLQALTVPADASTLTFETSPLLQTRRYALDVNSLIDLLQHRVNHKAIGTLFRAGFNHLIHLVVTSEAVNEIARAPESLKGNATLELVNQLPILPAVERETLLHVKEDLRSAIFPRRSKLRKGAQQDDSDLIHLALCIHHRLAGFVTSERALLRAAAQIKMAYRLDIISPYDLVDPDFDERPSTAPMSVQVQDNLIDIKAFRESERPKVEELLAQMQVNSGEILAALSPGVSGDPRSRLCVFTDNKLTGFSSWNIPQKFRTETIFYIYLDESAASVERAVDHLLERISRDLKPAGSYGLNLRHSLGQTITRSIAQSRGYRSDQTPTDHLFKIAQAGVVTQEEWPRFRQRLQAITGVKVTNYLPNFDDVKRTGLELIAHQRVTPVPFSYFEFETLISPGLILYPGRPGVLIPIQKRYAEELLGDLTPQMSLLPSQEALLRIEKAYFKKPRNRNLFERGMIIIFYVSGQDMGAMKAIGAARVTSNAVLSAKEAAAQYQRQGVLPESTLRGMADSAGSIQVITFDNFSRFTTPLTYSQLKETQGLGKANFITAERIEADVLADLLKMGFSGDNA